MFGAAHDKPLKVFMLNSYVYYEQLILIILREHLKLLCSLKGGKMISSSQITNVKTLRYKCVKHSFKSIIYLQHKYYKWSQAVLFRFKHFLPIASIIKDETWKMQGNFIRDIFKYVLLRKIFSYKLLEQTKHT